MSSSESLKQISGREQDYIENDSSDWETSSIVSVPSTVAPRRSSNYPSSLNNTDGQEVILGEHQLPTKRRIPSPPASTEGGRATLDAYLHERGKFIRHIQRRAKQFTDRSQDDYARARWGKEPPARPPKPPKPLKTVDSPALPSRSLYENTPDPRTPKLIPSSVGYRPAQSPIANDNKHVNIANNAHSAKHSMFPRSSMKTVTSSAAVVSRQPVATTSASRAFATTLPVGSRSDKRKKRDPNAMELEEATKVLCALEISNPSAAYLLTMTLRTPKAAKVNLRGRVLLPSDPRRVPDIVLVFAEANSPSARLARGEGVAYVGAEELYEPLLDGELQPTKVLCTPGMLGGVTARLARFLGPKGMMPTVRRGGVGEGEELVERIREAKGSVDWMADADGLVRGTVGRAHFSPASVDANVRALVSAVRAGLATNSPSGNDDALTSRKAAKAKSSTGIERVYLETTNCCRIEVRDIA